MVALEIGKNGGSVSDVHAAFSLPGFPNSEKNVAEQNCRALNEAYRKIPRQLYDEVKNHVNKYTSTSKHRHIVFARMDSILTRRPPFKGSLIIA